jgi:hypothetical protein
MGWTLTILFGRMPIRFGCIKTGFGNTWATMKLFENPKRCSEPGDDALVDNRNPVAPGRWSGTLDIIARHGLTDDQFNKALEIFQEFGPRRRIPVHERWAEVFRTATVEDFQEWQSACRDIEAFALRVALQVRDNLLDKDSAIRQISEQFPRLSRDRVGHAYSQAIYFSLHE